MRPSRLVIPFTLLFVLSQANLGYVLGPLSPNIIAVQLTFDSQVFWQAMAQWGPEGMARLRATLLPWDMLHPFIYAATGYLLVMHSFLFAGIRPAWRGAFAWTLAIAGACDQIENACALYLLSLPFGTPSLLIPVSATFSFLKWVLAVGFALLLLGVSARRLLTLR